jgi:hypothetical protein
LFNVGWATASPRYEMKIVPNSKNPDSWNLKHTLFFFSMEESTTSYVIPTCSKHLLSNCCSMVPFLGTGTTKIKMTD